MSTRLKFSLIMVLAVVAALLSYPREDQIFKLIGLKTQLKVQEGLDLKGGAQLVFQADLSKTSAANRDSAITSLIQVIQRRANPTGTSEVSVQKQGSDRVVVELPGVSDVTDAINRIGKTAQLTFLQRAGSTDPNFADTGISGKDVDRADVDYDTATNQPIVTLTLKSGDSTQRFADLTTKLNQSGGQLVTMLDQDIIFGPATVSSPITDGKAQLQGNFKDVKAAKTVADEINAGALPVPVTLVSQRTVGPTLGRDSLDRSIVAGIIGLTIVAIFMIAYYRLAGLLAVGALAIYTLLTLALYKLSGLIPSVTIVLTLAGIAGFILSIGMAVDANILIFERMKEEIRDGKSFVAAIETGFDRAWTSIRDSNISTLMTCVILYIFSGATPIIKGFAITLGLGVVISMFTAVVVSRTFLRMIIRTKIGRNPRWYGVKTAEEAAS